MDYSPILTEDDHFGRPSSSNPAGIPTAIYNGVKKNEKFNRVSDIEFESCSCPGFRKKKRKNKEDVGSPENHYHCHICAFVTSTKACAIKHEAMRHDIVRPNCRVFRCKICGMTTIQVSEYARHIGKHFARSKLDNSQYKYTMDELMECSRLGIKMDKPVCERNDTLRKMEVIRLQKKLIAKKRREDRLAAFQSNQPEQSTCIKDGSQSNGNSYSGEQQKFTDSSHFNINVPQSLRNKYEATANSTMSDECFSAGACAPGSLQTPRVNDVVSGSPGPSSLVNHNMKEFAGSENTSRLKKVKQPNHVNIFPMDTSHADANSEHSISRLSLPHSSGTPESKQISRTLNSSHSINQSVMPDEQAVMQEAYSYPAVSSTPKTNKADKESGEIHTMTTKLQSSNNIENNSEQNKTLCERDVTKVQSNLNQNHSLPTSSIVSEQTPTHNPSSPDHPVVYIDIDGEDDDDEPYTSAPSTYSNTSEIKIKIEKIDPEFPCQQANTDSGKFVEVIEYEEETTYSDSDDCYIEEVIPGPSRKTVYGNINIKKEPIY